MGVISLIWRQGISQVQVPPVGCGQGTWGTGLGSQNCTLTKPTPVRQVCGFLRVFPWVCQLEAQFFYILNFMQTTMQYSNINYFKLNTSKTTPLKGGSQFNLVTKKRKRGPKQQKCCRLCPCVPSLACDGPALALPIHHLLPWACCHSILRPVGGGIGDVVCHLACGTDMVSHLVGGAGDVATWHVIVWLAVLVTWQCGMSSGWWWCG